METLNLYEIADFIVIATCQSQYYVDHKSLVGYEYAYSSTNGALEHHWLSKDQPFFIQSSVFRIILEFSMKRCLNFV